MNEKELRDNFYKREKERMNNFEVDFTDLFNWLSEVTGINLKFEIERKERSISFQSQNIVEHSGVMKFAFDELVVESFSNGIESSKPSIYDKEEIDYTKDYDIYYWVSIHFGYHLKEGGTNGCTMARAQYKNGSWEYKLISN